jgi:nicotinate-nucleotide adenylyltransferase
MGDVSARRSDLTALGSIKVKPPLALPGQRIGLLGGSFNPPHDGHRLTSELALKRLALDQVWWIVTLGNPLKAQGDLAPLSERVAAARARARDPRIVVTDFEAGLPTAYTAATLSFLKSRCTGVRFVWIMGADNLASFHRWRHWRDIFRMVPIAVIDRPGWRHRSLAGKAAAAFRAAYVPESRAARLAQLGPPAWTLLTGPLSSQSSTELRGVRARPIMPPQHEAAGEG